MTTLANIGWPPTLTNLATTDLAVSIKELSVAVLSAGAIMLIILILAAILVSRKRPSFKAPLFTLIVIVTVTTTLVLSGATTVLNANSPMGGPVRWGSDYQIWACGNQLGLRNPSGLVSNRIGSPTLYEQNDERIHYDGTPADLAKDTSLGSFFQVVGGEISDSSLVVPLNSKNGFVGAPATPQQVEPFMSTDRSGISARFVNGQKCGDDKAEVQAFVYSYNPMSNTYSQTKLDHPADYQLSHSQTSPPGDCVIVEFAPPTTDTTHLCHNYGVRDYDRCTQFGVAADKVASCDLRELR